MLWKLRNIQVGNTLKHMNYVIHYVINYVKHYLRNMETDETFAGDDRTSASPACHSNTILVTVFVT
jgi:hypothetical protein